MRYTCNHKNETQVIKAGKSKNGFDMVCLSFTYYQCNCCTITLILPSLKSR